MNPTASRLLVLLLAILAILAGMAGMAVLWACGPYWPNFILGSDELVFEGPYGIFTAELARLGNPGAPPFAAIPPPDDGPAAQTAEADLAETKEILAETGTPADRRQVILDGIEALRAAFAGASDPATLTVPGGLPPELALYLQGAVAWHLKKPADAEAAWKQVLDLPENQRRHRSTWAAFMLGRLAQDAPNSDPEEAVRRFRLTRELAAQGFADSLGLAASSLGWEAMAETAQGHPEAALILYKRQMEAGDPTALDSILAASEQALGAGPEALARIAREPEARALLTAYLVSRDPGPAGDWLKALEAAGVKDEANADRIAWAAYLAGDFEQAASWLGRAREASPIARWVRARLLLRDGKLDEARTLLASAARDLPETGMTMDEAFDYASAMADVLPAPQRARGEEAVIRVTQKDFTGALDEFLRAGYWMDAAYLAERVLSLDELETYVDANWPAEPAAKLQPPAHDEEDEWETMLAGGYAEPAPERLARDLRDLLGRRLAREGKLREATAYLREESRQPAEELAAHLEAGRDKRRTAADRAGELFQAACLTRYDGMEVTGTEVEPDWTLFSGGYDLGEYLGDRLSRRDNPILPMSPEEAARVEKYHAEPQERFHYRYRAADLAWDAARLLPAGDQKAGMLATAGSWIKNRNPAAADRFYKELVRCCGATELGRQAEELSWFPAADACPQREEKDGEDEE
jgi:hypothetical protein